MGAKKYKLKTKRAAKKRFIGLTASGYQHWRAGSTAAELQPSSALLALDEAWGLE